MRSHFIPARETIMKRQIMTSVVEVMKKLDTSYVAAGNIVLVQAAITVYHRLGGL